MSKDRITGPVSKAETGRLRPTAIASPAISPVTLLRIAIILAVLAAWEFLAHSGWLYRDVVPSLLSIGRAMAALLTDRNYYYNLGVTAVEIGTAPIPAFAWPQRPARPCLASVLSR